MKSRYLIHIPAFLFLLLPPCNAEVVSEHNVNIAVATSVWRSPLGLEFEKQTVYLNGFPLLNGNTLKIMDASGNVILSQGYPHEVLRNLPGIANLVSPTAFKDPVRARVSEYRNDQRHSRQYGWILETATSEVIPVSLEYSFVLGELDSMPVAELRQIDLRSGKLMKHLDLVKAIAPHAYMVYSKSDGRPQDSALGDVMPHPSGSSDGSVPFADVQHAVIQQNALYGLSDPWLDEAVTASTGNNVIAFFNSEINADGEYVGGLETTAWGPLPDDSGNDFHAVTNGSGNLDFRYDPDDTESEYFGFFNITTPPDPADPALNSKIVQAFYATNWLHDFFHQAGFDEIAGNAQANNHGRGGLGNDPLIVHAGYSFTLSVPTMDGESPILMLGLNTLSGSRRDASMDFSVTAHEWAHYMIGRLAGGTGYKGVFGMANQQGVALHEGIADFVALLVSVDAQDSFDGAFPVGAYFNLDYVDPTPDDGFISAPPDAMYRGIRRYPYSVNFSRNPLTFRNLVEPLPTSNPPFDWKDRAQTLYNGHTSGEIFAASLFQCFAGVVGNYDESEFETARLTMARYLVAALQAFPENPTFVEARNALFLIMNAVNRADYEKCREGFAARGMGAGVRGPDRDEVAFSIAEESFSNEDDLDELQAFTDLGLSLKLPASAVANKPFEMQATIDNNGPSHADDVIVRLQIPVGAVVDGAVDCDLQIDLDVAECDLGRIEQGGMETVSFNVRHSQQASMVEFSAVVSSSITDVDEGNNSASGQISVEKPSSGGGSMAWLCLLLAGFLLRCREFASTR